MAAVAFLVPGDVTCRYWNFEYQSACVYRGSSLSRSGMILRSENMGAVVAADSEEARLTIQD
jgi:hypothetical protein